jgi:hypothetical protein
MSTISVTRAIIVMALDLAIVVFASNYKNSVFAHQFSTVQERYQSGYNDGARACGSSADVINTYRESPVYLGHTILYQQGYDKAAITDCSVTLNLQDNSQHIHQSQGNTPHVTCINVVRCDIPNHQDQQSTNLG